MDVFFFSKYKNPSVANVQKGVEILAEKQLSGKNLFYGNTAH